MTNAANKPRSYATALSIAGLDPSGGAGLLADIKTFSALGVYGMAAATAITAQNTLRVRSVEAVSPDTVYAQIAAIMDDMRPQAVKIGMVNDAETILATARALRRYPPRWLVIDPIMLASSGAELMRKEALGVFKHELLPMATLLTPNLPEACRLTDRQFHDGMNAEETASMAKAILQKGPQAVLIKGGHRSGSAKSDTLYHKCGGTVKRHTFTVPTVLTNNTHGTGCTLSAAITAFLALGCTLEDSVSRAKRYITKALRTGADVQTGHGHGAVNHFFNPQPLVKL